MINQQLNVSHPNLPKVYGLQIKQFWLYLSLNLKSRYTTLIFKGYLHCFTVLYIIRTKRLQAAQRGGVETNWLPVDEIRARIDGPVPFPL